MYIRIASCINSDIGSAIKYQHNYMRRFSFKVGWYIKIDGD